MGYLDDQPTFQHQLLLVRDDALWLVRDDDGAWTLPGFVGDEQHTAEVEQLAAHVRARFGIAIAILGTVAVEHDAVANRVRKADLAEPIADFTSSAGRWWPRAALADLALASDSRELVARWCRGALAIAGDTAWSKPGWHAEAIAWVAAVAAPVSAVVQVRVSEFSTVLRVSAGGRACYLKCVADGAEVAVAAAVARRSLHVPRVIAADVARRCVLMEAFDGAPLAHPEDLDVWAAAARACGALQRDCASAVAVGELVELGCRSVGAAELVAPFAALVDDREVALADEARAALRGIVGELGDAAVALDRGPVPRMLEHGDLWPSNVLVGSGGCAIVDWEDVRIAHPFLSMFQLVNGAHLDRRFADHPTAAAHLRDAYLAGWTGYAEPGVLAHAYDAAHDIAAVAVAASYRRQPAAIVNAHPWMREMPAYCLERILARRSAACVDRAR